MAEIQTFFSSMKKLMTHYEATGDSRLENLKRDYAKQYNAYNRGIVEEIEKNFELYKLGKVEPEKVDLELLIEIAGSSYDTNKLLSQELYQKVLEYSIALDRPYMRLDSLSTLGSIALIEKKFEEGARYFKEYFELINFEDFEDITWFIYPAVKYYQCLELIGESVDRLEDIVKETKLLYQNKLQDKYHQIINDEYEAYKAISIEDEFTKQKLDIYVKLFIPQNKELSGSVN